MNYPRISIINLHPDLAAHQMQPAMTNAAVSGDWDAWDTQERLSAEINRSPAP
jgi:hypothetical protein